MPLAFTMVQFHNYAMSTNCAPGMALLLGMVLCSSTGCHSGEQLASGTPGAHLWFRSSAKLDVKRYTFYDTWGTNAAPPSSSCTAWSFTRDTLTETQQSILDSATLQELPSSDSCTADGFDYCEAIISDQDGSAATYRDTNCDFLRVPDAKAILSYDLFHSVFPLGTGGACQ